MKVLLIKDVFKLGRAGDIKKVADGYGRNFLIPQGLAVLATTGAVKQTDRIRKHADATREALNTEMGSIAEKLAGFELLFPVKASESGKLYGSVTNQMITDTISEKLDLELSKRQVEAPSIRTIGEHKVTIRLTFDLTPEITIIVHREGEKPVREDQTQSTETDELAIDSEAEPELEESTTEPEESTIIDDASETSEDAEAE